ncbi:MAG: HAMP domain-containing sensor histidine kinase [Candidatus Obscuribacterales bacterium]
MPIPHIGISVKGCLLIVCPLLVQVFLSAGLLSLEQAAQQAEKAERRSKEILVRITEFQKSNYDMVQSTVLFTSFAREQYRQTALAKQVELAWRLKTLEAALKEQPEQADNMKKLSQATNEYMTRFRQILIMLGEGNTRYAAVLARDLRDCILVDRNNIAQINEKIIRLEQERLSNSPDSSIRLRDDQRRLIFVGIALNFLAGLIASFFFFKDIASRIAKIYADTRSYAAQKPMQPVLEGNDEISQLDRSLHEMANQLTSSQERETAMLANAGDVIFTLTSGLTMSAAGGASQLLWGSSPQDLLGTRFIALIDSQDETRVRDLLHDLEPDQRTSFFAVLNVRDHSRVEFQINASRSRDGQSIYCVARDVSEARRIERAKQEFVNMLSHDLRTPLMSQLTFLELLSTGNYGELSEKGAKRARSVANNLKVCAGLVDDFLDIEQMETGKFELRKESCEVTKLIVSALDLVADLAQARGIEIVVENIPAISVMADERRVVQVIQNFVSNAIKYGAKNESLIQIESRLVHDPKNPQIEIAVMDNGPGLPLELKDRLFDRYASHTQLSSPSSRASLINSNGLGLAICKEIIQAHGGTLGGENRAEGGCKFWFRLPLEVHEVK